MKAIQIKFLPATSFRQSRMKAWTEGGNSVTVPFQHEISCDLARAEDVAQELICRMGWHVNIAGMGTLPNGDWVAVLEEPNYPTPVVVEGIIKTFSTPTTTNEEQ